MVVTDDEELFHILLALSADGWTRNLPKHNHVCGTKGKIPSRSRSGSSCPATTWGRSSSRAPSAWSNSRSSTDSSPATAGRPGAERCITVWTGGKSARRWGAPRALLW